MPRWKLKENNKKKKIIKLLFPRCLSSVLCKRTGHFPPSYPLVFTFPLDAVRLKSRQCNFPFFFSFFFFLFCRKPPELYFILQMEPVTFLTPSVAVLEPFVTLAWVEGQEEQLLILGNRSFRYDLEEKAPSRQCRCY
jgi:hypothetical protein